MTYRDWLLLIFFILLHDLECDKDFLMKMHAVLHGPSGPYATSEYEHSSIPATVKKIFNLQEFLTKRDAWAGTFECVLNRTTPRTDCPGTSSV